MYRSICGSCPAFYGMLRPFDGIVPYRLEMQAKPEFCCTLYRFWGQRLGTALSSRMTW